MDNEPEFVNVSIRIRPNSQTCENKKSSLDIISNKPPVLLVVDRSQTYHFDNIFNEESNQEDIYNVTVKHLVEYVKQGYSGTVFAYGQTGTGKSFTIGTDAQVTQENLGLIPRSLHHFFEYNPDDDSEVETSLSFIEIYNTKVFDLLNNKKIPLLVKGMKAEGYRQEKVFNMREAKHFLEMGNRNRHIAETNQNSKSSRSHAIFTIYCKVRHKDTETIGKLNLVDLAGCERPRKTLSQGCIFQEGVNINKSLFALGQVMTALSTNSSHIPYRQSLLTSMLKDSLNTNNYISLIACVSAQPEDVAETVHTLDFSLNVKKVKNKPEVNEVVSQYKKENPTLFDPARTSMTPFKKPATPSRPKFTAKKYKPLMPLPIIGESSQNSISAECSHDSKSLGISGVSSITNGDLTQQSLSPVIKKYMTALESSLMDKLQNVLENTLKRPTRSSLAEWKAAKENIDSTPSLPWDRLENEVSKLVRMEFAQLTGHTHARATSSPLEDNLEKLRKVLDYDTPPSLNLKSAPSSDDLNNTEVNASNVQDEFKIPRLPASKADNRTQCKRTPSVSPIQTPTIAPRRSVRLSMRKITDDYSIESSYISMQSNSSNVTDQTNRINSIPKRTIDETLDDTVIVTKRRCSTRVANKRKNTEETVKKNNNKPKTLLVTHTPAGKRLLKSIKKDSPSTSHTKEVLGILNEGTLTQLKKLPTIGESSALQIMAFRKIKGPIKTISDLSRMPGWNNGKCNRFAEYYFLKKLE